MGWPMFFRWQWHRQWSSTRQKWTIVRLTTHYKLVPGEAMRHDTLTVMHEDEMRTKSQIWGQVLFGKRPNEKHKKTRTQTKTNPPGSIKRPCALRVWCVWGGGRVFFRLFVGPAVSPSISFEIWRLVSLFDVAEKIGAYAYLKYVQCVCSLCDEAACW